ncbi:MAG TPA: ABC transporter substrate-binding protein [Acidimicrobiales bacterium]
MQSTKSPVVILMVMALVATACGARLNDEQRAALASGGNGGAVGGTGSLDDGLGAGDPSRPVADPGGDGSGAVGGGGTSDSASNGGSASAGGGPATVGGGGQVAVSCAADNGGATDTGVGPQTITLGNVSLLSGPIQGFANTAVGATKAFMNYQNSRGGICGRALDLEVADDRFDSGANKSEHERLKSRVFAFVGSLSVVDDGGVAVLKNTNIPDVTLALSDLKLQLENNFAPTPLDLEDGGNNAVGYATWLKVNKGITRYALIWPGQATARNRADGYRLDYNRAGLTNAYEAEVGVTETNYTPHASAICDAGADGLVLTTTLEVNGMARLTKALKQQGCLPQYSHFGAQAYGQQFIELAGDAADGVRILISFDIIEGSTNELTKQFAEWFTRTNPGLQPDFFAIQSWVAGHMLATAIAEAGAELTRDNVIAALEGLEDYTAEGMIAPITPGTKTGPECFLVAKVTGGAWAREEPAQGFICP